MTFASNAPLLRGLSQDSPVVAMGLWREDDPVGLALAQADRAGDSAELLSIFVQPQYWSRGLGGALLEATEAALRGRSCRSVRVRYSTGPCTPAFERMLAKRGWQPPQPHMLLAQIRPELSGERWVAGSAVPAPFEAFRWADLAADERARLESVRDTIPASLWPFDDDAPLEPSCSVGLRCDGEVVGWMIVHRVAPNAVRYTALYVREPWRRPELTFALLAEAIRRKQRALGAGVVSSLAVLVENRAMLRVLERKFYHYAQHWQEMRVSTKALP